MKLFCYPVAISLLLCASTASAVVVVVPPDMSPEPSVAPVVDPLPIPMPTDVNVAIPTVEQSTGGPVDPEDPYAPSATIEVSDEALVMDSVIDVSPSPEPVVDPVPGVIGSSSDPCEAAFQDCNLRFNGLQDTLPTFDISGPKGASFTPRLVWRDASRIVGLALSNWEGELITKGAARPFSAWETGGDPLSRSQFKAVPMLPGASFSGIGHEAFTDNEEFVRGKCVRVRVSDYQLLDKTSPPKVILNINGVQECVVFRTAP